MNRQEQSKMALANANAIRIKRAGLRRWVNDAGSEGVIFLLKDPPVCLNTASLFELLSWQHGWGRIRVNRFQNKTKLNLYKRIENTTERERNVVIECLTQG
jgi:hypothetical protein